MLEGSIHLQPQALANGVTGEQNVQIKESTANETKTEAEAVKEDENPIMSPLIMQCSTCNVIVGDTCSLVDLNPTFRTITTHSTLTTKISDILNDNLEKGDNVLVDEGLHTSISGLDYGSTYYLMKCRKCTATLGRVYRTTMAELDLWRGQYTFSSESLSFYEIPPEFILVPPPTHIPVNEETNKMPPTTTIFTETSIAGSETEIVKLQKFCLFLYDQVTNLENELADLRILQAENLNNNPSRKTLGSDSDPFNKESSPFIFKKNSKKSTFPIINSPTTM